jgi:hypothetical protein
LPLINFLGCKDSLSNQKKATDLIILIFLLTGAFTGVLPWPVCPPVTFADDGFSSGIKNQEKLLSNSVSYTLLLPWPVSPPATFEDDRFSPGIKMLKIIIL